MEPSAPHDRQDQGAAAIPRSRPEADVPLEGEIIPKGAPIGRPAQTPPGPFPPGPARPGGYAPGPIPPGPAPGGGRPGRRRVPWKTVLIVLAAVVGVGCIGGLGVAYYTYDQVTEPDRGTPGVAVRQYLQAVFDESSGGRESLFTCKSANLSRVDDLKKDLVDREKRFGIDITVTWENLVANGDDKTATVTADIRLSTVANGTSQREVQRWEFATANESGWRVCGARDVP